jgi:hypothetical protein
VRDSQTGKHTPARGRTQFQSISMRSDRSRSRPLQFQTRCDAVSGRSKLLRKVFTKTRHAPHNFHPAASRHRRATLSQARGLPQHTITSVTGDLILRAAVFLLASVSGVALLLKVYGIMPMHYSGPQLVLPATALLAALWLWAIRTRRERIAAAFAVGSLGGLAGTIGYDVARVPFMLLGQRIFVPIRVYGVLLTDASASSWLTDAVGWIYHFSNGICFGLMYAVVMPRRPVIWAVLWAFMLETIAVLSPFARIFGVYTSTALLIAYFGHVAYGVPLGILVRRWDEVRAWQRQRSALLSSAAAAGVALMLVAFSPLPRRGVQHDPRVQLRIIDSRLQPDIVRFSHERDSVVLTNTTDADVAVRLQPGDLMQRIARGSEQPARLAKPGLYRLFVERPGLRRSSFILAEPIER